MSNEFDQIESFAERALERMLRRFRGDTGEYLDLIKMLDRVVEDHAQGDQAADIYEIRLAASSTLLSSGDMEVTLEELSVRISDTAERLGLHIDAIPQVSVSSSKHLKGTQILTKYSPVEDVDDQATRIIARGRLKDEAETACLISLSSSIVAPIIDGLSIGSDQSNDLVISTAGVRPRHAVIRKVGSRYMLYDLGSPSGILLGDIRVRESLLEPGDVITIGNEHLVFSMDGEEPAGLNNVTPKY